MHQKQLRILIAQESGCDTKAIAVACRELFGSAKSNGKGSMIFRFKFEGKQNILPVILNAKGKELAQKQAQVLDGQEEEEEEA